MQTLRVAIDIIGLLAIAAILGLMANETVYKVRSWLLRRLRRRELERKRDTGAARKGGWMPW